MKRNLAMYITALTLLAALAVAVQLAAQDKQDHPHSPHHYRLVDLGSTFGGPQSYFVPGSGLDFAGSSVLTGRGTVVGFADTPLPDPFPNFCWSNCLVDYTFQAGSDGVLTNLGALPGGGSSAPIWITANGLIAGTSENGQTDPLYLGGFPEMHAVVWQQGQIMDLGTLPEGGYQSEANAVNSAGQVVGSALNSIPDANSMAVGNFWYFYQPYGYQQRAFLWDKQHGMQDLGTLPGGTDAEAILINERGQVVGHSYTASTQGSVCFPLATSSFLWEKGKGMVDLGGFGGTCTLAQDLNNQGQVSGLYDSADGFERAFLWERGSIHDLGGSIGGLQAGAFAMNEHGQAVGFATLSGEVLFHATLWKHVGEITDIGVAGDDQCSYAAAINVRGQVVGSSIPVCNGDSSTFRAILWEDGSIFDLNTLVPSGSALYLQVIQSINDRGEIAGTGADGSGNQHAFLLIPCDENHPGIEGCDYSLVDGAEAARVSAARSPQQKLPAGAKLRGVRGLFLGPMGHTPTPSPHEGGRQAVSTPPGDDFGSVSGEAGRSAQHEAVTEISSCSTSERGASAGEVPARGYVVHGACSVNISTNTLTGVCQGPLLFSHTCAGKHDTSQCPTGQRALEPEYVTCGNFGPFREDLKRPCQFIFE
jgi:probable HAF family extracellular repeat protein